MNEARAAPSVWTIAADFTVLDRDTIPDSDKWRLVVSNALQLSAMGFLAGGLGSLLLFKSPVVRTALTTFGAGFGLGRSYVDLRYMFQQDVVAEQQWIALGTYNDTQQQQQQ